MRANAGQCIAIVSTTSFSSSTSSTSMFADLVHFNLRTRFHYKFVSLYFETCNTKWRKKRIEGIETERMTKREIERKEKKRENEKNEFIFFINIYWDASTIVHQGGIEWIYLKWRRMIYTFGKTCYLCLCFPISSTLSIYQFFLTLFIYSICMCFHSTEV